MVYNTQNYWVFGLYPLSGILKTREHNVLRRAETDPVSETLCSLVLILPDDGQSPPSNSKD
jgi:hypothetical protein